MKRTLSGLLLLLVFGSANAALLSRAGGRAYYDDVLNITWLADANLAATNDFGVAYIYANGEMTQSKAQEWIGAMNLANYLGTNTWRLPTVIDTGTPGCNLSYTGGTDCGWNVDLSTGEMAHLFYSTLGNEGEYTTSNQWNGCGSSAGYGYSCLTNTGPFSNISIYDPYWSGTTDAATGNRWIFDFNDGLQVSSNQSDFYAWAVSPADVTVNVVPVPGAVWMFGSALGLIGLVRRKVLPGTA